jgi:hypothetical protein
MDGSTVLGSSPIDASGVATFLISSLSVGAHSIAATYIGNASYGGSVSPAITQIVNKADTTTTLTSNRNPSNPGQRVTFKAAVSPSTATGTVQFFDGSVLLGTAPVSGGTASLATSSLAAGNHSITAHYSGDDTYNGSTSAVLTQSVTRKK